MGKKEPGWLLAKMPGGIEQLNFWGVAISGLALDLWSKHAVFAWMKARGLWDYPLISGLLSVVVRENPGAAFSIAEGHHIMLRFFAGAALLGITGYFLFGGIKDRLTCLALGLFMGGVTGNFYDRLFNEGLVRDFIDVYYGQWHWPAFNVADSMLCIAVGLLLIRAAYPRRSS
jgi:signal peptidase II